MRYTLDLTWRISCRSTDLTLRTRTQNLGPVLSTTVKMRSGAGGGGEADILPSSGKPVLDVGSSAVKKENPVGLLTGDRMGVLGVAVTLSESTQYADGKSPPCASRVENGRELDGAFRSLDDSLNTSVNRQHGSINTLLRHLWGNNDLDGRQGW